LLQLLRPYSCFRFSFAIPTLKGLFPLSILILFCPPLCVLQIFYRYPLLCLDITVRFYIVSNTKTNYLYYKAAMGPQPNRAAAQVSKQRNLSRKEALIV
jgi:hypothetical protein